MTKTTFLGYVPSLKSKHEATIVNGRAMKSKGGSIRYLLEGEYDGRKTLPKTVSKEDFVKVYGFDAKEAEAVIMTGELDGKDGKVNIFHQVGEKDDEGFKPETIVPIENADDITQAFRENAVAPDGTKIKDLKADTVGSPSPASVEPPAPSEKPFPQEPSNENFSAEEKEESDEPKTQEFTVVLQEGDKLELVDIPEEKEEEVSEENEEEQEALPDDETTEKEEETAEIEEKAAENVRVFVVSSVDYETDGQDQDELGLPQDFTFALDIDDIGDTTDMQEIADEIVDDISDETGFLVSGFYFQERMPDGTLVSLDAENYEAVQAKVTRPVKEDETDDEEEESEEGLSTGAKVALGVGALAVGAAIFGAEGEYPEEFLDEFYDFDSNPTADTQDEETLAIAYAAWLESKRKEEEDEARMLDETHSDIRDDYIPYESETDYSRIYGASGSGEIDHDRIDTYEETEVHFRHDNPMTTYDWTTSKDNLTEDEEDMVDDEVRSDIGSEPSEGEDSDSIDVDGVGTVDYTKDTDYGDKRFYGLAAEHESESDGYTYAYTKGHKDGMDNEVIYRPSIETDREKTIFKKILKQKAEGVSDLDLSPFKQRIANGASAKNVIETYRIHGKEDRKELMDYERRLYETETVGSPSPSGPSSTPEPAEATGSEPSNEEFKSDNTKMALGLLGLGIGAVALLGGDRIKKLFDRFG